VTEWGKGEQLAEDEWESILLDGERNLWAAGRKHVMVMLAGTSRFMDRSIPGSDPENTYGNAPLTEDPEGRVLVPTEDGVARWEGKGWAQIGHANGFQRISHSAGVAFDATGDAWIGGHGNGVFHWFGYRDWEGWDDAQGLPSSLVWVLQPLPGGGVLAGTDSGPASIDPHSSRARQISSTRPWKYGQVDGVGVDRDGSVWVGGMTGSVLRIDPKTGRTEERAKLPASMEDVVQDSQGRLFFTVRPAGIFVRESPRAAPHRILAADSLLDTSARIPAGCESPDGAVWFLDGNRLLRRQDAKWTAPQIDGLTASNGSLLALDCAANGAIWVTGENAGTWRMTPVGDRLRAWKLELPSEFRALSTVAVLVDRRGWVWLGTDSGLLVWNGQAWRQLTVESGLIWNDVDQGVLKEGSDGSLWVGTSGGVAHLEHPERAFDPVNLDISVTRVQRGDVLYPADQVITLPWSSQQLQIQVSSSTMRNRSELVFRFRLDGLQTDWVESQDGKAVFAALPPGKYTFRAMARNPGLDAASSTVQFHFRVLPPWWRTNWFFAFCGLCFLLLLMALDRLRARHLRAKSRQLEGMVHERTLKLEERTQELEASREQLRIRATQDGLTGMLNHDAILRALAAEMDRAKRENRSLVLAMVDLDHFKRVNDVYGHLAGDQALRTFAAAVRNATRVYDHAGRYGGEEFLLVLSELPAEALEQRIAGLHAAISNLEVRVQDFTFTITCSIGATVFNPSDGPGSIESLLASADRALYAAKAAGRNCFIF
jgi:diguanylate cyclase (GGDEF)-like protein